MFHFFLLNNLNSSEDDDRQDLVQGIHATPLDPLRNSGSGMGKPKALEYEVDTIRLNLEEFPLIKQSLNYVKSRVKDLTPCPTDKSDCGLEMPSVALKVSPIILERINLLQGSVVAWADPVRPFSTWRRSGR